MKKIWIIAIAAIIVTQSCQNTTNKSDSENSDTVKETVDTSEAIYNDLEYKQAKELQEKIKIAVTPDLETETMLSPKSDVADDPAIWIHPTDRNKSTIIGTDKFDGLHVYDINGKELFYYQIGRTNNVDIRYDFPMNGDSIDIVGCSNRMINGISLLKVNPADRSLTKIGAKKFAIDTLTIDDAYGFCFYKSPKTNKYYAFLNGKNGLVQQYELIATKDQKIDIRLVRELRLKTQPEGMVADDEQAILYVGEEAKGVWRFGAEPNDTIEAKLIFDADTMDIAVPDIEGIALYYAAGGKGYLIVSSQGNFTYIVLDRETNAYIGSFKVIDGKYDGIEETDGLEVINLSLGDIFPQGVFIAQDGFNTNNERNAKQNFKLVSWDKIAKKMEPNLIIDNQYDFRK